jgi:hypothetical protein
MTTLTPGRPAGVPFGSAQWPRIANVVLGVWLFISAFLWSHSAAQMTNTWILGVLAVVFALIAASVAPVARYANTLLAIWLFISAFALPTVSHGTAWNNVIVAIFIFVFSLIPSGATAAPYGRRSVV